MSLRNVCLDLIRAKRAFEGDSSPRLSDQLAAAESVFEAVAIPAVVLALLDELEDHEHRARLLGAWQDAANRWLAGCDLAGDLLPQVDDLIERLRAAVCEANTAAARRTPEIVAARDAALARENNHLLGLAMEVVALPDGRIVKRTWRDACEAAREGRDEAQSKLADAKALIDDHRTFFRDFLANEVDGDPRAAARQHLERLAVLLKGADDA